MDHGSWERRHARQHSNSAAGSSSTSSDSGSDEEDQEVALLSEEMERSLCRRESSQDRDRGRESGQDDMDDDDLAGDEDDDEGSDRTGDEDDDQPMDEKYFTRTRAWFAARMRSWSRASRIHGWDEVKTVLGRIAWLEDFEHEAVVENMWHRAVGEQS
jgi:hypothetical protein